MLAVAEMAIPGVFLIWMAAAALVTGVLTWLLPIGLPPMGIGVMIGASWPISASASARIAFCFAPRRRAREAGGRGRGLYMPGRQQGMTA